MGKWDSSPAAALKRPGDFALKHKMFIAYHTHGQRTMTGMDEAFPISKGNMSNIDLGHMITNPNAGGMVAVRDEQAVELEHWLASVTAEELSAVAPVPAGPGWPPYAAGKTVLECLHVILNEEWEHHGFCVRTSICWRGDRASGCRSER